MKYGKDEHGNDRWICDVCYEEGKITYLEGNFYYRCKKHWRFLNKAESVLDDGSLCVNAEDCSWRTEERNGKKFFLDEIEQSFAIWGR